MKLRLLAAALASTLFLAQPAISQTDPVVDLMEQAVRTSPSYRSAKADMDRALATNKWASSSKSSCHQRVSSNMAHKFITWETLAQEWHGPQGLTQTCIR